MKPKVSDTDHSLKKVRGPYNSKGKDKTKQLVTEETARIVETLYSRRPDMVFTCLKCEYNSTQRGHLKEHVEKHIEGLKYFCSFCNKKSSTSQSLRGHMQKYHWSRSKKKKHGDNHISATTVHCRKILHPQYYWGAIWNISWNIKSITDFGLALLAPILPNKDVIGRNIEGLEYPCNQCENISRSSHNFIDHMRTKNWGLKYLPLQFPCSWLTN